MPPRAVLRPLEAHGLKAMLADGQELALIDLREELIFSQSHLLFARSVPLSRLEAHFAAWCRARAPASCCATTPTAWSSARRRFFCAPATLIFSISTAAWRPGRGRPGAVLRRQCPEQGVRRIRRARQHHPEHRGLRARPVDPRRHRHGGARQPAVRRISARLDSNRRQRAGCGAGAAHSRHRAVAGHPGRGQLRRPHAEHHRHAVADQCRRAQQGGGAAQRHHGLEPGGPRLRERQGPARRRCFARRPCMGENRRRSGGRTLRHRAHRSRDIGALAGAAQGAHALPLRCARSAGVRSRPRRRRDLRARRTAGPSNRPLCRHARGPRRAGR